MINYPEEFKALYEDLISNTLQAVKTNNFTRPWLSQGCRVAIATNPKWYSELFNRYPTNIRHMAQEKRAVKWSRIKRPRVEKALLKLSKGETPGNFFIPDLYEIVEGPYFQQTEFEGHYCPPMYDLNGAEIVDFDEAQYFENHHVLPVPGLALTYIRRGFTPL